jgi:hypothetical protein
MGWGKLQKLHQTGGTFVRSAEFTVVIGLAGAAWAAGAEPFYYVPLILAGLVVALLCTTTAAWSNFWRTVASIAVTVFFACEAGVLYSHTHPFEPPSHPVTLALKAISAPILPKPAAPPAAPKPPPPLLPKEKPKDKASEAIQPLFVECNNGFLPTLNIGPNDRVEVLQLAGTPGRAILGQQFLLAGGTFNALGENKTPRSAWTCKVTNYNSAPIIGIKFVVHIKWYKTSKEGNTTHQLGLDVENDSLNQIAKVDPGSATPFVFYVESNSDRLAEVSFVPNIVGTRLDTNETLVIPLRFEPPLMEVWPTF